MRLFLHPLLFTVLASAANMPQLAQVQSVYILPMSSGVDQFLANRLARLGKFQVVTDPKRADTILTDRIGEGFESKLEELYRPPPPVVVETKKTDDDGKAMKTDAKSTATSTSATTSTHAPKAARAPDPDQPLRLNSFGRGRGNFFLVDRHSRNVIWSIYEHPKNGSPEELDRIAERVVSRLKRDMEPRPQTN